MQTATWLTSRDLTQAAGPWDTRLLSGDDVEYFCRVLLASEGTRFVPEARVFYGITPLSRLSYIGTPDRKKDALLLSMKLHIQYARSAELHALAAQLGGPLEMPRLRPKSAWTESMSG